MEQSELSQYIKQQMASYAQRFHWEFKYNPEQCLFEIYMLVKTNLQADSRFKLMDVTGRVNNGQDVYLADRIAIYDPKLSFLDQAFYLRSFDVDFKEGMEKGLVDALLKYTQQVIHQARSDFDHFLHGSQQDNLEFSFNWSDENFNHLVQTMKDTGRYDYDRLSFKVKAHQDMTLIEKFQAE